MNNLEDIYNNIFTNIENYYQNYISDHKIYIPFSISVDFQSNAWDVFKKNIINQLSNNTLKKNIVIQIGYMLYTDGITYKGTKYYYIPVYIAFTVENVSIIPLKPLNPFQTKDGKTITPAPPEISFYINIITHMNTKPTSSMLSNGINENFYRELSYMEMSVDIFNHTYQPTFQLINREEFIDGILKKYNIELQCMGSMFINDPVNKRLCGLPKINTTDIQKNYPDVFRILQDQGVNYRKIINSGVHNPFSK